MHTRVSLTGSTEGSRNTGHNGRNVRNKTALEAISSQQHDEKSNIKSTKKRKFAGSPPGYSGKDHAAAFLIPCYGMQVNQGPPFFQGLQRRKPGINTFGAL